MTENFSNLSKESNSRSTKTVKGGVDMLELRHAIGAIQDEQLRRILADLWLEALQSRKTMAYAITVLDSIAEIVTQNRP